MVDLGGGNLERWRRHPSPFYAPNFLRKFHARLLVKLLLLFLAAALLDRRLHVNLVIKLLQLCPGKLLDNAFAKLYLLDLHEYLSVFLFLGPDLVHLVDGDTCLADLVEFQLPLLG